MSDTRRGKRVYCSCCDSYVSPQCRRDHQRLLTSGLYERHHHDEAAAGPNLPRSEPDATVADEPVDIHNEDIHELTMDPVSSDDESVGSLWESDSASEQEESTATNQGQEQFGEEPRTTGFVKYVCTFVTLFCLYVYVGCGASQEVVLAMLQFWAMLLTGLGAILRKDSLSEAGDELPKTWPKVLQFLGFKDTSGLEIMVVCPKCSAVYEFEEAFEKTRQGVKTRRCTSVRFPGHRQRRMRLPCNEPLMLITSTQKGQKLKPRKQFALCRIKTTLARFLSRPDFVDNLSSHKPDSVRQEELQDIYDGNVWRNFSETHNFFVTKYNLSLTMNVDWFNPFKRTQYSVGAIYFVVNNLPRHLRFRTENIIIAGLIPGPNEPSLTIKSYLEPIVADLQDLWKGIPVMIGQNPGRQIYSRAALMCVAADIPGARKVGGFLGHQALHGCSRCLKEFPRKDFNDKPDYSGYERERWPRRTDSMHRHFANKVRLAQTETERSSLEHQHGARYSELMKLPYYDCVKFLIIDPMHNLFLGTAKHVVSVWLERGVLNDAKLDEIDEKIADLVVPPKTGRLPHFSRSTLGTMTADQWKNWTCIYSTYALKGIVSSADYTLWKNFVNACVVLSLRSVTVDQIAYADSELKLFCEGFHSRYGAGSCTPNMHMHLHLKEVLLDYGPSSAFWLFSFERYNGVLESYPSNNRNVEEQLLRRFLLQQFVYNGCRIKDTVPEPFAPIVSYLAELVSQKATNVKGSLTDNDEIKINKLGNTKRYILEEHEQELLESAHQRTYGEQAKVVPTVQISKTASVGSLHLRVSGSRLCCVMASGVSLQPCLVQQFIAYEVKIRGGSGIDKQMCAEVRWLKPHPNRFFFGKDSGTQVWCREEGPVSDSCFIPLANIRCENAYICKKMRLGALQDFVMVVISCPKYSHAFPLEEKTCV